ncbi:MAG: DUF2238 domain-containing protein [Acidobacteria bacterium]|nr:DUF2238 domain-containing protein [Acidobacteriota bacterium]
MENKREFRLPQVLLILYLIEFTVLAIHPFSREVWIAENIPIVLIVFTLAVTYRYYRFSNTAYALMAVLIFLHTIGGYYTFERVPFQWITNFFGFTRNNFDRIAHFSVGFYAFAACELVERKKWSQSRILTALFGIFMIFTVAAVYEIIEWIFAAAADPKAGIAFLGSQGDIWDAQKDMLSDGLGAITAVLFYGILRWRK